MDNYRLYHEDEHITDEGHIYPLVNEKVDYEEDLKSMQDELTEEGIL